MSPRKIAKIPGKFPLPCCYTPDTIDSTKASVKRSRAPKITPVLTTIIEDPLETRIKHESLPAVPPFSEEKMTSLALTFQPDDQVNTCTRVKDLISAAMEVDTKAGRSKVLKIGL